MCGAPPRRGRVRGGRRHRQAPRAPTGVAATGRSRGTHARAGPHPALNRDRPARARAGGRGGGRKRQRDWRGRRRGGRALRRRAVPPRQALGAFAEVAGVEVPRDGGVRVAAALALERLPPRPRSLPNKRLNLVGQAHHRRVGDGRRHGRRGGRLGVRLDGARCRAPNVLRHLFGCKPHGRSHLRHPPALAHGAPAGTLAGTPAGTLAGASAGPADWTVRSARAGA
jgi:hypothetical protein